MTTRGDRQTPGGNEFSADRPSWALTAKTGSWTVRTGNNTQRDQAGGAGPLERYERPVGAPAPTLDTAAGRKWTLHTHRGQEPGGGTQVCDPQERPAPTLTAKAGGQWHLRQGNRAKATVRSESEPAPTLLFGKQCDGDVGWIYDRPATAVCGDRRLFGPGVDLTRHAQDRPGTVHLTEAEGAVLQGFPADYPWQGSRTKRWEQIGNAVPPPLALAVLRALLEPAEHDRITTTDAEALA